MGAIRRQTKPDLGHHTVSKYTVIKRLEAAGKFDQALTLLEPDRLNLAKWNAILEVRSDDIQAIALITAVGLDPAVILAK